MKITVGLFDNMVLQRGKDGRCNQRVEGECAGNVAGPVTMAVSGLPARKVGSARGCRFMAAIKGLPVGGPYTIKLSVGQDSIVVRNVLVGDVWILAGQSNMQGIGYRKDRLKPNPLVRAFYMDDHWDVAQDPLHDLGIAVDRVHDKAAIAKHIGTGPGVAFGQTLHKLTGVPQGLIACAHGGTSMAQWSPSLKDRGGESLYGALHRRFIKNGARVAGVFWYQGCSDTDSPAAEQYTENMRGFIRSLRRDFKNPSLPVVIVQIARLCRANVNVAGWNSIRDQQRLLPTRIKNVLTVPTIDLSLDDAIHISGRDVHRVGRRGAEAMAVLKFRSQKLLPPIQLKRVVVQRDRVAGAMNVLVSFRNVSGSLKARGRAAGFALSDDRVTVAGDVIYETELLGDKVLLKSGLPPMEFGERHLFYGFGSSPYCNITDNADRSLPAFGPIPIFAASAYAPAVIRLQVSALQPSAGRLEALNYPTDLPALSFASRIFDNNSWNFCNLHPELSAREPEDLLVYFSSRVHCEETMKVEVSIGYDGPVKVWFDGKEIYCDPDGINPAIIDDVKLPVTMSAGEHQVIIALGSNHGKAWGIFLRYIRVDVPLSLLRKGKDFYKIPQTLD
jgi:sialate O-acetylesterase